MFLQCLLSKSIPILNMKSFQNCNNVFKNHGLFDIHHCKSRENLFIQCQYCCLLFESDEKKTKHEYNCATGKCPVCQKWMKKRNLTRHMTTVHVEDNAMFPCDHCNYTTNRADNLKKHKCTQDEYPCKICLKCFETCEHLKQHSDSHSSHSCDMIM